MTRLPAGGQINRDKTLSFRFNGKQYQGFEGDTLASALLANNVRLIARSFKYHRPRGIVSAGPEEPNALVQVHGTDDEPNLRATTLKLYEGLDASSINCWPGPSFDLGAINSLLSPLLPAGFYYKTFMLGRWDRYAKFIRRAAGLGKTPTASRRRRYEKRFHHVDVLVVGAGFAGLEAALKAAQSGSKVVLIDSNDEPGGELLNQRANHPNRSALEQLLTSVDGSENINRIVRTTASGYYDHNLVIAVQQQPADAAWIYERLWHIRAKQVILATGAVERPLVFANNDLPGVMLAGAAQSYLNRYAVACGKKILLFTNNSSAYQAAFDLADAGLEIVSIVDARSQVDDELLEECKQRSIEVQVNAVVINASGGRRIRHASVAGRRDLSDYRDYACDLICVSGGWNPLVHLHSQSGAKPIYSSDSAAFVPGESVQNERSVGACAGDFSNNRIRYDIEALWKVETTTTFGKAFVDFQNDVTTADLELALRENYSSIEHVKRYTTAGMATDQGKIGGANVIGVVADQVGAEPGEVGTTTYRPPFTPVSFGVLAGVDRGPLILPARTTPMTQWNIKAGAAMNEAGAGFRRPFWFPVTGESTTDAISRAAHAVRTKVGIYDATPLGKFELHGPDVGILLNRLYTNRFDDLTEGQGRFGLMLHEDGRLLDDGVTFRMDDHWLMTCGTGAASGVLRHIERLLQTEWTDLQVYVVNVTSQWANICVCGPRAREVVTAVGTDIDLDVAFEFMQMKTGRVAEVSARVARVSYTGELSFEINVRRRDAMTVWQTLMDVGKRWDITPVGSETSAVLRIEKGFISAGTEGDNITNPYDAGLGWMIDMDKGDFIGRRTLIRDKKLNIPRQHVVGLLPDDEEFVVAEGSALLPQANSRDFQGHVTASCYSPTLGRSIALALLKNGHNRHGEKILISGLHRAVSADICRPVFYDPRGERMRS